MQSVWVRRFGGVVLAGLLLAAAPGVVSASVGDAKSDDGVARSGVKCGPGVRQVTWSDYAAPCVPEFAGDNGGATAHGVTGDTITIAYRLPPVRSLQGGYVDVEKALIPFFNKNYELYGRKVVLKTYTGQGSQLSELAGQGQALAQADAQTVYDMGAFAAAEGETTTTYQDALIAHDLISLGAGFVSSEHLAENAPFLYANPSKLTADRFGRAAARVVCARMNDLPAIFSGDDSTTSKKRVFGLVAAEDPHLAPAADAFAKEGKARCDLEIAQRSALPLDVAAAAASGASVIAQMKAAGVTTIFDTSLLAAAFLMSAATKQNYHPEWLVPPADVNTTDASQADHTILIDAFGATPALKSLESYEVLKLADPDAEPPPAYVGGTSLDQLNQAYWMVLNLFNAIQAAGPKLTPTTFKKAWFSLPAVERGDFGAWKFGKNSQNMVADFTLGYWSSSATDPNTGKRGAFVACNNGDRYPVSAKNIGTGQLDCFGG